MAIPLGNRDLRETAEDSPRPWHQETLEIGAQDGLWASMDVQGRAGLGCVELETSPAVAILGLGLVAPGGLMWGPGLLGH